MDTPNTRDKVAQLGKYIEENLRASQSAGLKFVDPRYFGQRLMAKQNHVVFGRRGAGKSTLVSSCQKEPATIAIYLNLETYKDITFPNIIVQVFLVSCFRNSLHKSLRLDKTILASDLCNCLMTQDTSIV